MRVYHCFPGGKAKALTMSYDDGKVQDERLVGIFNKYGIKGTFNLNFGLMDQPQRIPRDRVKEVYRGHEVATHTMTHPTIARCPMPQLAAEILEDRKGLEELTGGIVRGHAYPNGSYNQEIEALFSMLGIAYARTTKTRDDFELPDQPMAWKATCHHNDPTLSDKAQWFLEFQKKQYLKLFYVWGHSYEFDNDNNWEVIEEFCKIIGGREDIWYATNIEIVEFLEVKNRLRFSASGEMVYNPSAASAWLAVDDRIVEIKGGEMMNLS
jgi:peptidoglycan/xylan/chitin deacetylase (PgdA/CDA1 family)